MVRNKLKMCALLRNTAVSEHDDAVALGGLRDLVRDEHDRASLTRATQCLFDELRRFGIERGRGLVEHQNSGVA